jgi:hypothetical protein
MRATTPDQMDAPTSSAQTGGRRVRRWPRPHMVPQGPRGGSRIHPRLSGRAVPRVLAVVAAGLTAGCASSPRPSQVSGSNFHVTITKASGAPSGLLACSASQLAQGKAKYADGFGTLGTSSLYITQTFLNIGDSCVLDRPSVISVSKATGPFKAVKVANAETAASYIIPHGQSRTLVLAAWWHIPGVNSTSGTNPSWCKATITGVKRLLIIAVPPWRSLDCRRGNWAAAGPAHGRPGD